ncbi:acyl-CoA dehydrogenase family protein [Kitasatospora sp. NPDC101447]|uniref:acyl-CoA dehydrogenase family protein n=1 Tax=Kitasatospora sp. NPDC101447 TaxID=3364102 RepID=UPI00382BE79B
MTAAPPDAPGADAAWCLQPRTPRGRSAVERAEGCLAAVAADAERHDREASYVTEAHRALAAAGLMGATVPPAHGGLGVSSLLDTAACLERIASADASAALVLHMQLSRGLGLAAGPSDPGSEGLLRAMADGSAFVAGAATEAGAGYFTVRTSADPGADGTATVSGRKIMVSGAPAATHFAVRLRVRTPDGDRLGSAIVPRSAATTVADDWDGLGMRGSASGTVHFHDAEALPWSLAVRGPWGTYDPRALGGRMLSSGAMLGIYLGLATAAHRTLLAALRRAGADRPGAWLDAAALRSERELAGTRALVELFLGRLDDHDPADGRGTLALAREWQLCRLRSHDTALALSDLALSAAGASAYRWGHPAARILRDARAGQYMQPYGPSQAAEFIRASGEGTDPGLMA